MDVGIVPRGLADLGQDFGSLRIVGRAASGEHQLAIEIALHNLVGANHSHRVLQAVEAGDLREQRPLFVDAEAADNGAYQFGRKIAILIGKRIDGRVKQILRDW